jgi:hypothetical protein
MAGSEGFVLRHALGFAADLWRMCVINQMTCRRAAKSLGLETDQVTGAVRLLKKCGRVPSPERLAVTVMLDPGLDNQDIAEIFGRSVRWASVVRSQKDDIAAEEFIDHKLEFLDDHLQPGMPTPAAIRSQATPCWTKKGRLPADRAPGAYRSNLRVYSWNGYRFASLPNFVD